MRRNHQSHESAADAREGKCQDTSQRPSPDIESILQNSTDAPEDSAVLLVDAESFKVITASSLAAVIFGCDTEQLIGVPLASFHVSESSCRVLLTILNDAWHAGRTELKCDYWLLRKDGSPFIAELTVRRVTRQNETGYLLAYILWESDLKELR